MFGCEEIEIGFADYFLGSREFELLPNRLADAQEAALVVLEVNAVRQVIQQCMQKVPFLRERFFGALALDGVAHRPGDDSRINGVPLHQIILRALMHRVHGERFIVLAAQDDNGRSRHGCGYAVESLKSTAIGQSEVKQDEVNPARTEALDSLFK